MWELSYEAPVGKRVNRYWRDVCVYYLNEDQEVLWFVYDLNKWCPIWEGKEGWGKSASTHHRKPKSIKAFKNYLEKHPELKGYQVRFINKYHLDDHGLDVTATWKD